MQITFRQKWNDPRLKFDDFQGEKPFSWLRLLLKLSDFTLTITRPVTGISLRIKDIIFR